MCLLLYHMNNNCEKNVNSILQIAYKMTIFDFSPNYTYTKKSKRRTDLINCQKISQDVLFSYTYNRR